MALKLRTKVNFPATVTATGGLKVVKNNGTWTVSADHRRTVVRDCRHSSARSLAAVGPQHRAGRPVGQSLDACAEGAGAVRLVAGGCARRAETLCAIRGELDKLDARRQR